MVVNLNEYLLNDMSKLKGLFLSRKKIIEEKCKFTQDP